MAKINSGYLPAFTVRSESIQLISEISEILGKFSATKQFELTPLLRRGNRLKSIQASLAIENNTLTLEQVTDIINGKRVLGDPREIQEVKNAFAAYELIKNLNPHSTKDLLKTHKKLMSGLVDSAGMYRSVGVGIMKGKKVVHIAPSSEKVRFLMKDLLTWLEGTHSHPLISSCVFHYEFEYIHPFVDGNGRMGRLWQTLILSTWKPIMAYLPVESVIHNRQKEYYKVLATADKKRDSTPFIEFMLRVINQSLKEVVQTDQVSDQVSDQVKKLLKILTKSPLSALNLMKTLKLSHRPTFRNNYLHPALQKGLIEMTNPQKPNSRNQQYKITPKGISVTK